MKIIKVKDMIHDIFKGMDKPKNNLEIYRFEEPQGYMYINKEETVFSIVIKSDQPISVNEDFEKILKPYLYARVYLTVNVENEGVMTYFKSQRFEDWYGYYAMHLQNEIKDMTIGELEGYQGHDDLYIDILGRCFEPMRALHDFKPHNWYKENYDSSVKEFVEADKRDDFYAYKVDGQIIGVGVVEGTEIDVMGIKPELQKNGYGKQILRGIVKGMKMKHERIDIGVVESNKHVLRLYKSEGFVVDKHDKKLKNYDLKT